MGEFFYRIVTWLYIFAIYIAKFFNSKAAKMWKGRRKQWKKIRKKMSEIEGSNIWIHCSSLGEFEQGRPVIEAIKIKNPEINIIVTFFSPSGYEVRKNYNIASAVFYLPFDSRKNARKFIDYIHPKMALFIKYEYWHYYLDELKLRKVPTISISSIFRPGQLFFKPQGEFYRNILEKFDHFFVQNEVSKKLLNSININEVTISGDTRFDRVAEVSKNARDIPVAREFKNDQTVMVIGSSWSRDIDALANFINDWCDKMKFIIAPHEIEEKNLRHIETKLKDKLIRFSNANNVSLSEYNILLIDNIGMLSSLYQYGEYAYVGGAFDHGIHNTLEAAAYGIPVFCGRGRRNIKYQEVVDLAARGGIIEIETSHDMEKSFKKLYDDKAVYRSSAQATRSYIDEKTGATKLIMEYVNKVIAQF